MAEQYITYNTANFTIDPALDATITCPANVTYDGTAQTLVQPQSPVFDGEIADPLQ
ncbi:MAG: hypothetical protein U0401_27180 [Anaerolineae bacterium]